jgi:type II secretory ATPase GspE/PulE/Tfp pilus assembly ATPase PilB-like protein
MIKLKQTFNKLFKTKDQNKSDIDSLKNKNNVNSFSYSTEYSNLINSPSEYNIWIDRLKDLFNVKYINSIEEFEKYYTWDDFEEIRSRGVSNNKKFNTKLKVSEEFFALPTENKKTGLKAIGVAYPNLNILDCFYFSEFFFIGPNLINYIWGVKNIEFLKEDDSSITEKLKSLLSYMETLDVNDLHFFKESDYAYEFTGRFRDTAMRITNMPVRSEIADDLVRAILTEAREDPFTQKVEIKALIKKKLHNGLIRNFRISIVNSSVGSSEGKSVSIRKLAGIESIISLDKLNYSEKATAILKDVIFSFDKGQGGIALISGSTNSGKTTLLYALLTLLKNKQKRIFTIENPVEITIPGIIQLDLTKSENAESKHRMTIEDAKNIILRQDPDIALVSEVRTKQEVKSVFELASTGHLAFSTVHANDVIGTIKRVAALGEISNDNLNLLTKLIVNQQLVKKLCQTCKGNGYLLEKPCPDCNHDGKNPQPGFSGRLPVYEIAYFMNLELEDDITDFKKLISENKLLHITKEEVAQGYLDEGLINQDIFNSITNANEKDILKYSNDFNENDIISLEDLQSNSPEINKEILSKSNENKK